MTIVRFTVSDGSAPGTFLGEAHMPQLLDGSPGDVAGIERPWQQWINERHLDSFIFTTDGQMVRVCYIARVFERRGQRAQ